MRITIDTGYDVKSKPIIKIEGSYTIDELIKFLSKIYPDFTWKDFEITDTLPTPSQSLGLWGKIVQGTAKDYNPIQSWPSITTPYDPIKSNPITYTGTNVQSEGSTLTQYYDTINTVTKKE